MKNVTIEYKPIHILYKEREDMLRELANVVIDITKNLEERLDSETLNKYSEELTKLHATLSYVPTFLEEISRDNKDIYRLLKKKESLDEKLYQIELQIRLEEG